MQKIKAIVGLAVSAALLCGALNMTIDAEEVKNTADYQTSDDYSSYYSAHLDTDYGEKIYIDTASSVLKDGEQLEFSFNSDQEAVYAIKIEYAAQDDMSGNLDFALKLDGSYPFSKASALSLKRLYYQSTDEFENDSSGNDIRHTAYQSKDILSAFLTDSTLSGEPLIFEVSAGSHTLSLEGLRGSFKIIGISLEAPDMPKSYSEYKQILKQNGYSSANADTLTIEAEHFLSKNSVTVLPSSDRTSAATSPQSAYNVRLNTVGGSNWKTVGDAVTYSFKAEKDGIYNIALRFRQNLKDGIYTCRRLLIDGSVPFKEAENLCFYYNDGWQSKVLGDEEPFGIYFTAGEHTITLEAVSGDTGEFTETISAALKELNDICRKIVLITGNTLDVNRDYNFSETLPDEISEMKKICKELKETVSHINSKAGTSGSYTSIINKIIFQLEDMTKNPRSIAKLFTRFKSNLGSLGEWLLTASEQPLEIDTVYILPQNTNPPYANSGFFENLIFGIKSFFASYVTDYNTADNENSNNKLKVWIQTGRDQGEIIRELVNRDFAKQHNASVQLEIVTGTLLESVLSGNSPDIVFDNTETTPMDYALRNAVVDFTEFSDYKEFSENFPKAAIKPASYDGKVFGIPQTMSFHMFFYRTDIFEQYGYKVPSNWTEVCDMIPTLQRNVHEIGIPHDLPLYATLLYQSGGRLYSNDLKTASINSNLALEKFVEFTEFFTLYDCSVSYNFANRFRSGEMPCAIAPYTEYNQLIAFAPEIKGNWEMVPIPGTLNAEGELNNLSNATMTYIMMLRSSKNKELAWDYIKWFMSKDIQVEFANRMESILGSCAKVNSANSNALIDMSWTKREREALISQMNNTTAVSQMPGGYYMNRVITFAFNRVYNNSEDAAETLTDYYVEINQELARKHKEFRLD